MKRLLGFLCCIVTLLVFADAVNLDIDASTIRDREYANGAYSRIYGARIQTGEDILTEESAVHWDAVEQELEKQELETLENLSLAHAEQTASVTTRVTEKASELPIFQKRSEYRLAHSEQTQATMWWFVLIGIILITLCVLSFLAAQFWRKHRKERSR